MNNSKRVFQITVLVVVVFSFLCMVQAGEKATKDECMAKAKEAAELVKTEGLEAAITKIKDKDGTFVWKDTYVFLMQMDGKTTSFDPIFPHIFRRSKTCSV
jgi:hypothetical protein